MLSKVCILTAGRGTRMAEYSAVTNKALLPINGKATISHIIEKFPVNTEFVIAVGYFAEHVETYIRLAHPSIKVNFVNVDNFDGPGSGPGHSILSCKNILQDSSFYLITCDTLWKDDLSNYSPEENWLSVGQIQQEESPSYCNVIIENDRIKEIRDKVFVAADFNYAWTGLAHIADAHLFWQSLQDTNVKTGSTEKQVVDGFYKIVNAGKMKSIKIDWTDVGTYAKYMREVAKYDVYDFGKPDEFIYIVNANVIKFFSDQRISDLRVKKSLLNESLFPKVKSHSKNFYSYEYVKGETLYIKNELKVFEKMLKTLSQNFWLPSKVDDAEFKNKCRDFYFTKSEMRINNFLSCEQEADFINGVSVPSALDLLHSLDQELICNGKPYFIHGDLQPDNILYSAPEDKITLIDWRHDFSGSYQTGDLYYDFAKLLAGIKLDFDKIRKGIFEVNESGSNCNIKYETMPQSADLINLLRSVVESYGCNFRKVELLAGLVYLNMSPLHKKPFGKLLNSLGRLTIYNYLKS